MVGYSGIPLVKKLGIKPHTIILTLNAPKNYLELISPLPEDVKLECQSNSHQYDLIHFFSMNCQELKSTFGKLKLLLKPHGSLWISWPKGSAQVQTDLNENSIREVGLKEGLVDVKVCAVDDTWSALKFVYRFNDRSMH